jgi:2-oxoglutarate dehydrogenase E2 component (dihydrolipoamide succinyltransferase)
MKLGFMSFFTKAVVAALQGLPVAQRRGPRHRHRLQEALRHRHRRRLAARDSVVPVVRNADALDFAEHREGHQRPRRKAKENKLTLEELSGGTFTSPTAASTAR